MFHKLTCFEQSTILRYLWFKYKLTSTISNIMTVGIIAVIIMTVVIMAVIIMTVSIMKIIIMTVGIMTVIIMTVYSGYFVKR
jgi:hypothetical protein